MRSPVFVCHKAILSGEHRPNGIDAIRECLAAGVERLEVDVHSLDGDDYAIFHDRRLEEHTTGSGTIGRATPETMRAVRFTDNGREPPPLLSDLIEMARDCATELQLDLKDWRPLSAARLRALVDTVAPVKQRVIISSGQDWNLRLLHRTDPELAYGFDPGHYLDHAIEGTPVFLPRTMGAYGYRDDHPLAFGRTEATHDYLCQRFEQLAMQAPGAREWFISYRLALQMLDDGFNAARFLHDRGVQANVWTPDFHGGESLRMLRRIAEAGFDRVTTNTRPAWLHALATHDLAEARRSDAVA